MTVRICTWNINSVRLREAPVLRLVREEAPDVLCLQETKAPADLVPLEGLRALGYAHAVMRGQNGYNGVATSRGCRSRTPGSGRSAPAATRGTWRRGCHRGW